ncbi:putative histidine kinase HHK5p [Lepidopterella palustris CBS 459.81]|uniref:histidine kinase n=1 Tax=Lepidopterella palustris CBS 459.81 TaxID=1314670 RepID=A0A8E2EKU6_9PEZI|nr:putative histidine kinase HHK5p [Lepidopterella palustris CBS 459.81]
MVKMRISIREQLGCLVLLASLIGLAVIAIATWITNHNFVLGIRASRLTLTASLKAAQLSSNLFLMQSSAKAIATRILIQNALQRYNQGNDTAENWVRSESDLQAVFQGDQQATLLLQARVFPVNSTVSVMNATAPSAMNLLLPYDTPNGTQATLGDPKYGFPPELYPQLNFTKVPINSTYSEPIAIYNQRVVDENNYLLMGPLSINASFSIASITMPIINNTSLIDVLGWLTVVLNGELILDVIDALEGLDHTGVTMLFGPNNSTNKFANGIMYNSDPQYVPQNEWVRFLVPPTVRSGQDRHPAHTSNSSNLPFDWNQFVAVKMGFTEDTGATNNAGSLISTKNEEGYTVAVGYAVVNTSLVDWMVIVEQSHSEVWGPIVHLRNIIIACVFGTMGGMILLAFPVAHLSCRPIRRLRDATRKSITPPGFIPDDASFQGDGAEDDDDDTAQMARKEGFFGQMKNYSQKNKKTKAERTEEARRRQFRIPGKVKDHRHFIHDELTDLTQTFNEMTDELMMQYTKLEERVQQRTAELEQSKKAAEAANESKTLFIANISHELKTPLNGILGMCAVCMSEDDPIKLKRSLGIIYKSGDLLLNLLTDLLTFSKNQVGQQLALDEKEFRLRDVSAQVLAIFEKQAKESGIDLQVKFEGSYDAYLDEHGRPLEKSDLAPFGLGRLKDMILWGDQHRILQVVINLVSNSLKFTPQGGSVLMTIRCTGESAVSDHSCKVSAQSRQSSIRNPKNKTRGSMSETSMTISIPKNIDTANAINAYDKPSAYAQIMAHERSATPPLGKWLQFEFEVEDTGPGIPDDLRDKIFEPFVQGDLGLSKKFGGTGLGLSICSQLASLMKGTISLKSELGHGSVFTMQIPLRHLTSRADSTASSSNINLSEPILRQSDSVDEIRNRHGLGDDARSSRSVQSATSNPTSGPISFEGDSKPRLIGLSHPFFASNTPVDSANSQRAAMERVAAEANKRGDKVKVLVAEDNKTNQEVVLRMLKLEDVYDVTVAKDGQEALDKVKESMETSNPYNLIFMDVQMPNLDGLQSTRLIRQSGFSAPIVALTAYAEESNVKECLASGMDFFLSKPIRRPALKHVLRTYCPPIPEEEGEGSISPTATEASSSKANANGQASVSRARAVPGGTNDDIAPVTAFTNRNAATGSNQSPAVPPMS